MYQKEHYQEHYDQTAKNVWSKVSHLYGRDFLSRYWDLRERDVVRRLIKVNKTCRVLDVASGPGRWVLEYSSRGGNVTGLDISIEMIKAAKSKVKKSSEFVHGDSEHLPFKNGTFDIVSCFDAFPDFPHPVECLVEMKRVLKSEGILIVEQTNILSLMGAFLTISRRLYSLGRWIRKKKKNTGFRRLDEWNRYEFPTSVFLWLRNLSFSYKIIGVNMIPSLPFKAFLSSLCKVEQKIEKSRIFNTFGYRLIFLCQKK